MYQRLAYVAVMCLGFVVPVWGQEGDGDGPSPQVVVQTCLQRTGMVTHRTVHVMRHRAMRCIPIVVHLKQQGRDDEATEVAENCIQSINAAAEYGVGRVIQITQRCVGILEELGAPPNVINGLLAHSQGLAEHINEVRQNLTQAVLDALNGDDGGGGDGGGE